MRNMDFYVKICNKLEEEGIDVISFDGCHINARYGEIDIVISFEMCLCHGGRLSISSPHCNFYYRIEHEEYDETKGIVDEKSELLYEIENEMIPVIKGIRNYVYAKESWTEGKEDNRKYQYYNSIEMLTYSILEEKGLDIFAIDKEFTHYCPNPEMAYRTTVDDFKDGKLYLTKQPLRLVDGKWENDNYWKPEHIICKIFRKGKKDNG